MSNTVLGAEVLRDFIRSRRGSVATISALALVPIIIGAGAGLDISRAMSSQSSIQDAVDATGLALAHLPTSTDETTLQTKGDQWMAANLVNADVGDVELKIVPAKGELLLTAESSVPTTLTAIFGIKSIPIKAESTVKWGLSHVEIALVLDNTGSMAGTKIETLKTAATDLVKTLEDTSDTSDPNSLKIAVVPFSHTVNIGSSYQGQSWLDGTAGALPSGDDIFETQPTDRFTAFTKLGQTWKGCVESRVMPYDVQDTAPTSAETRFFPYFAPDEPDDVNPKNNNDYYGNNYISDVKVSTDWRVRQGNWDKYKNPSYPCPTKQKPNKVCSGVNTSKGGPNDGCSLASIQRLTSDMTAVKTKLSQMVATGNTNVAMGMMWGWHAITPNAPFSDGVPYGTSGTEKIMVVLTDGDNTNTTTSSTNKNNSTYSGIGYIWQNRIGVDETSDSGERTAQMDSRMALLCANAKAQKITIYTVRIDMSGAAPPVLMNCATGGKFYDVPNVGDLSKAFTAIAGEIGKLRIAK